MMRKLMHSTVAAAGLAALLSVGCATNDGLGDTTDVSDQVVQVRPEESGQAASAYPAPGPAKVDSDGNIYASSAAPGSGNAASVGTNTNVNVIPQRSKVDVRETTAMTSSTTLVESEPIVDTTATIESDLETSTVDTSVSTSTPIVTTTTRTESTLVPMTSSVQESTATTTQETATRTRMRKD